MHCAVLLLLLAREKERKLKWGGQEDWIPASTHIRSHVKERAAPKEGQLWGSVHDSHKDAFPVPHLVL